MVTLNINGKITQADADADTPCYGYCATRCS